MNTTFTFLKKEVHLLCAILTLLFFSFSTTVSAEEETMFQLYCPNDYWIDCDDELQDLSIYGYAYYHDYNGYHYLYDPVVVYDLNACDVGTITRTWSVQSPYGGAIHSCTQTIYVSSSGAFTESNIHWPMSGLELTGCNVSTDPHDLPYGYGPPTYDYEECSMIGIAYSDDVYQLSSMCTKIIREWKVIDWCQYAPNTGSTAGLWTFNQTIKVSTGEVPELNCPEEIEVIAYNCVDGLLEMDPLYIDPGMCGGDFTITNNSPYAFSNGADISGIYPLGYTNVTYTVTYGCGQRKTCNIKIKVVDKKAPTPYCLNTIAVALMGIDADGDGINEDGMVEVWAKDLDYGSFSSCGHHPLSFSFSSDVDDMVRVFTCNEVGLNEVQMWVTDSKGNQAWCLVYIDVQNNGANIPDCEPYVAPPNDPVSASGRVLTPHGEAVGGARIIAEDMNSEVFTIIAQDTTYILYTDTVYSDLGYYALVENIDTMIVDMDSVMSHAFYEVTSDDEGAFMFDEGIYTNGSFMFKGTKEEEASGIDMVDVMKLFDVLMERTSFTSPYEYLAADIDGDKEITFGDLQSLLLFVLGREELPMDKSWLFIDASYEFASPELALQPECPNFIALETEEENVTDVDFIAVKIGDINLDYNVETNRTQGVHSNIDTEALIQVINKEVPNPISYLQSQDYIQIVDKHHFSPNPFNQVLDLELVSSKVEEVKIMLYSLDGKLVLEKDVMTSIGINNIAIDTDGLPKGILLYQLQIADQLLTGKVVKQ